MTPPGQLQHHLSSSTGWKLICWRSASRPLVPTESYPLSRISLPLLATICSYLQLNRIVSASQLGFHFSPFPLKRCSLLHGNSLVTVILPGCSGLSYRSSLMPQILCLQPNFNFLFFIFNVKSVIILSQWFSNHPNTQIVTVCTDYCNYHLQTVGMNTVSRLVQ